jgi:ubiquinone/menaquinone biosynthesis C-methylase UbiE
MTTLEPRNSTLATDPAAPNQGGELEPNAYVLGTDPIELERLGFQHRLWSDAAHGLWRRAQIRPGQRVLDVGCGPGFATVELAQLVTQGLVTGTSRGEVVGIDQSVAYLRYAENLARTRGLTNIRTIAGDVQKLDHYLPGEAASFDLAFARWVFCFLPSPLALIQAARRMLKVGAHFAVHDYFNYASITAMPRRPGIDRAVKATMASWADHGGNAAVAGILPALFVQNGFEIVHLDVHQRLARSNDSMFHWQTTWWRTWGPKLVETNYLSAAENDEMQREIEEMLATPTDCFLPPPVTEILVRRRD